MPARWNSKNRPLSLKAFRERFPDDNACAAYLEERRWPDGFVCPHCAARSGWKLQAKRWTWECRGCGKQTSVTSGTVMHGSKVPLSAWFLAAHLLATHSNGMSALQIQAKLGFGSYKTAWLLLHKLRRAMVAPDRSKLGGDVELDETIIPFYTKAAKASNQANPGPAKRGRSHTGNISVMGAVELQGGTRPRRIRLAVIPTYNNEEFKEFIACNVQFGSHLWTDGFKSYTGLVGYTHTPRVIGQTPAHLIMPWIHRVFSNLKRWSLGVFHGFRPKYLDAYLNEFVFRWNRRRSYHSTFERLIGIGVTRTPMTCRNLRATASC